MTWVLGLCIWMLVGSTGAQIQHTMSGVAWSYDANASTVIDQWVGTNMPLVQVYDDFCGYWVFDYLTPLWNVGNVPMFTFQASSINCKADTGNTAEEIANGLLDDYLNTFLNITYSWLAGPNGQYGDGDDRRMYMRFMHEMNGNWYPWSGNATAYILAWTRFHDMTVSKWGIDNNHMQFVWNVNNQDVGGITAESYYPGDDYVDWVSIDGYNNANSQSWSSWQDPDAVFGPMFSRLQALAPSKPIGIPEVGCSTSGYTPQDKGTWIAQLYTWALQNNFKFVMWFNDESGFTDYAIFGSVNGTDSYTSPINGHTYLVYDAYTTAVQSTAIPLDGNPRILTDDQFAGNFS